MKTGSTRTSCNEIDLSNSFRKVEKKRRESPENMNEGIIDVLDRDVDCGNTQMDSHAVNEGGDQDDIQASFPNIQCPSISNVLT